MTFQPGQSGNPKGRKVGIVDKRAELRGLLEPHAKELVTKLVELAKSGEPTALRLCIERLIPRIKPDDSILFELPDGKLDTADNMLAIADNITKAVASGQLSIEEAQKFNAFIAEQRRIMTIAKYAKEDELRDEERQKLWAALSDESPSEDS